MFHPLRLLCVVVILSLCTSTAMVMAAPAPSEYDSQDYPVQLWRFHNGQLLDPKAEIIPCSAEDKLRGCVISPEEWQISVDNRYYGVVEKRNQLEATSTTRQKTIDASKGLSLGTVRFPDRWTKKKFLNDLLLVKVGGRFEYADSVVKKMRDSRHATCQWKSDGDPTTWDAMYKKVEVPI
ncbi:hypothetical protein F5051DRAFT_233441 [Lentinula edodes]|nr:hypothetical protein F5051DRAFT_233441 [Lentinula edodes]